MVNLEIDGHSALITASSSGLGKASAAALAEHGANVVINGRNEEKLKTAVEEIRTRAKGEVIGIRADLTDAKQVERLVNETIDTFGTLDHLVTSSGGPTRYRFEEASDGDWYHAFDLLVMSVVRTVRESINVLCDGEHGTAVMITSRVVKEASPTNVLSSSVRMSVIGLEKTLSKEYGPNLRVNSVLPGPHHTPRRSDPGQAAISSTDTIPVGDMGDPKEFGEFVAYLSSPRSAFINGVAIPVDGGIGATNL